MSDLPYLHHKIFIHTIVRLLHESGFDKAKSICVEVLAEVLGCYIYELGRSTKIITELSGRTEPLITDVVIALVEIGHNANEIVAFGKRSSQLSFSKLQSSSGLSESRRLQVGNPESHFSHIPDTLPPFPDPHTYIKTSTHKPNMTDYQVLREKLAVQKMDTEQALTKFIAKTGNTENLFSDDPYAFPLIANKLKASLYCEALMSKEEDSNDEEAPRMDAVENKPDNDFAILDFEKQCQQFSKSKIDDVSGCEGPIDNPFLRPIKMPKIKLSTSKKQNLFSIEINN